MTKQEAVEMFGTRLKDLGEALGDKSVSSLSQWPEVLNQSQMNQVIGAATRKGIKVDAKHLDPYRNK